MNSDAAIRPACSFKSRIPVPASFSKGPAISKIGRKGVLKVSETKIAPDVLEQNKVCKIRPAPKKTVDHSARLKTIPNKCTKGTRLPSNYNNTVPTSKSSVKCGPNKIEGQSAPKVLPGKTANEVLKGNVNLQIKNAVPNKINRLVRSQVLPGSLKTRNDNLKKKFNLPIKNTTPQSKPLIQSKDFQKIIVSAKKDLIKNSKNSSEGNAAPLETHNLCQASKSQPDGDDPIPVIVVEKENHASSTSSYFASQKDIKFEADEKYRRMILSDRGISPNLMRISGRSSIYTSFAISSDPHKEALKAIENLKKSERKGSLAMQPKPACNLSPFRNRSSFYSPRTDPKEYVMRSLAALEQKRLIKSNAKSAKKVSFNLNVQEITPQQRINFNPTPSKTESHLTNISEKSEENTPNSPLEKICVFTSLKENHDGQQPQTSSENLHRSPALPSTLIDMSHLTTNKNFNFRTPQTKLLSIQNNNNSKQCTSITTLFENATKEIGNSLMHSLKKLDLKCLPANPDFDNKIIGAFPPKSSEIMSSPDCVQLTNKQNSKYAEKVLYTPKPISSDPKSCLIDNCELPEFLTDNENDRLMSENAPICTPFVLKSLAKNSILSPVENLSPVRLKLDFIEEKGSPKAKAPTKTIPVSTLVNKITTTRKQLNDLADEECSFYLHDETFPALFGRYIQNPVSLTLTEGDEMHFIPLKL